MKNLLLLAVILSLLATTPSLAKGYYFSSTVSAVQVDQGGRTTFTTSEKLPTDLGNGCPTAANEFFLAGDKDSASYKTLVSILETAVRSKSPVGLWFDGCNSGRNTTLYLGRVKHV